VGNLGSGAGHGDDKYAAFAHFAVHFDRAAETLPDDVIDDVQAQAAAPIATSCGEKRIEYPVDVFSRYAFAIILMLRRTSAAW
jgi:hypothetical protein